METYLKILLLTACTVSGQTLLNVGHNKFKATCESSNSSSCQEVLDEDGETNWIVDANVSNWMNISLPRPYQISQIQIMLTNLTVIPNNMDLEITLSDWDKISRTINFGGNAFHIEQMNETTLNWIHVDFKVPESNMSIADILIMANYSDVETTDGNKCKFPFVDGTTFLYSCVCHECKDAQGIWRECANKGVYKENIIPLNFASCNASSYFKDNFHCQLAFDNNLDTSWARRGSHGTNRDNGSTSFLEVHFKRPLCIVDMKFLTRNTLEYLIEGLNLTFEAGETAQLDYNDTRNWVHWKGSRILSQHVLVEMSLAIDSAPSPNSGFLEIQAGGYITDNCDDTSLQEYGPRNIDQEWCAMQALCYDINYKVCRIPVDGSSATDHPSTHLLTTEIGTTIAPAITTDRSAITNATENEPQNTEKPDPLWTTGVVVGVTFNVSIVLVGLAFFLRKAIETPPEIVCCRVCKKSESPESPQEIECNLPTLTALTTLTEYVNEIFEG